MNIPSSDAIIVHAYWLSQQGDGTITLSLRSKLVTQAAALLYKNSPHKPYIILTAGNVWGKRYPSLASLMEKELVEIFTIPKEKILIKDDAYDTKEEIRIALALAKQHHFSHLIDLASKKHFWTIPTLYKKEDTHPIFLSLEDVLLALAPQQTHVVVKKLHTSLYEWNYALYELVIKFTLLLDPNYKLLGKKAKGKRNTIHSFGLFPFLPADIYTL